MGTSSSSLENREGHRQPRQPLQPFVSGQEGGDAELPPPPPLIFGGPPLPAHAPAQPAATILHFQARQSRQGPAPITEEQQMIAVQNLATLAKPSLRLLPLGGGAYQLACVVDCAAPTTVEVHYACVEHGGLPVTFTPQQPTLPPSPPPTVLPTGPQQRYTTDPSAPFLLDALRPFCEYRTPHRPDHYPLVISLVYEAPEGGRQALHTYLQVLPPAPEGEGAPGLKVLRQRLERVGAVYELEELYGMGQDAKAEGAPEGDRDACVICITQPRDTTVMPCRHMCLCSDCAEHLRTRTNKCPICRAPIERLVTIHRQSGPAPP